MINRWSGQTSAFHRPAEAAGPDHRPTSTTSPRWETHSASQPDGTKRVRQRRAELDPDGAIRAGEVEHRGQGGREVRHPPDPVTVAPPGRVGKDPVGRAQAGDGVGSGLTANLDRPRRAVPRPATGWPELPRRLWRRRRPPRRPRPARRNARRIGTDTAAQIDHPVDPGRDETGPRADQLPRAGWPAPTRPRVKKRSSASGPNLTRARRRSET